MKSAKGLPEKTEIILLTASLVLMELQKQRSQLWKNSFELKNKKKIY